MDPITMMALGGAALGALSNKKDRKKGALMGLGLGLLGPAAFTALAPATAVAAPVVTSVGTMGAAAAPAVTAAATPAVTAGATGALNGVTAGYGGALGSGVVTASGTSTAELAAAELAKETARKQFLMSMAPQALGAGVEALTPKELQPQQTNYNASIAGAPQQAPSMYQRAAMNMQKKRSHLRRMS